MKKQECVIFDIDGTLSDPTHRRHYVAGLPASKQDWKMFSDAMVDDPPITEIITLLRILQHHYEVFVVTGRSDEYSEETINWLTENGVMDTSIYMRKQGDYRKDDEVKQEILDQILANNYVPVLVFDDRNSTVAMWRKNGIRTCQVDYGNF